MANRQRIVPLVLAAAVAAVAIVVIGAGGGDGDQAVVDTRTMQTETTVATEDGAGTASTPSSEPAEPEPKPTPQIPQIVVRDGKPAGGVQRLRFRKGGDIIFTVRSNGAGHVHLHGYDVLKDLVPGGTVRFDVPARIDGRFEVELEDTATLIATVEVVP